MGSDNCGSFCVNSVCVLCFKTKVCAQKISQTMANFEISIPCPSNDCVLLNTLKTLFRLPRELLDLQGLHYYFPENFRCNLTYYEIENVSDSSLNHIFESENFRFQLVSFFVRKIA